MKVDSVNGFTLVELVIVTFIIAVISMMAVGSYKSHTQKVDFRNAARMVGAEYAYLKQKAIAECVNYKMVLDIEGNRYKILRGGLNGIPSEYDEENVNIKDLGSLGRGIRFSTSTPCNYPHDQIVFQARGTTSAGSLFIENGEGLKARITSNLIGRVYVSFAVD